MPWVCIAALGAGSLVLLGLLYGLWAVGYFGAKK